MRRTTLVYPPPSAARTDYAAVGLPPSKALPEAAAPPFDGFGSEPLELAGAVKAQLERPAEVPRPAESGGDDRRSTRTASCRPLPPHEALDPARRSGRSHDVVGRFQSTPPIDPADVELGR